MQVAKAVQHTNLPAYRQAVQHYLRRSASKSVVASSQEVLSNLARPGLVIQSVLNANVVLPLRIYVCDSAQMSTLLERYNSIEEICVDYNSTGGCEAVINVNDGLGSSRARLLGCLPRLDRSVAFGDTGPGPKRPYASFSCARLR